MGVRLAATLLVVVVAAASCGSDDRSAGAEPATVPSSDADGGPAGPAVVLDATGCSSTIPSHADLGGVGIEIHNRTETAMAVVMGSYAEGYERDDLVAYGSDISTRPDFLENAEIFEVGPYETRHVVFDEGSGRYFAVCMDTNSSMIVLDDLVIDN